MAKSEALRMAKLDYLNSVNSNPYLWGSLVLFGNTEAVISKDNYLLKLLILFTVLSVGLILFIAWRKSVKEKTNRT